MTRPIKVWAWSEGVRNFGDELGPLVLSKLGYEVERVQSMGEADVLSAGSLLESAALNAKPGAMVWGSGLMHGETVDLSHLDVRAVRGQLSATACGLPPGTPTGDPGALVPELWPRLAPQRGTGVVRHYVDKREYPWADVVIDTTEDPEEVIDLIGSCRRIASSSLHGLIVAHAWGIPTVRLYHHAVAGGDFKWADWLSGADNPKRLLEVLP